TYHLLPQAMDWLLVNPRAMSTGSRKKKSKLGAARSSTRTNTTGTADAGQLQTKDQDQTQAQIQAPSSSKVSPETSGGAPIAEINNASKVTKPVINLKPQRRSMRHCRTLSQKTVYGAKMESIRKKLMGKTVKQLEQLFLLTEESDIRKQISKPFRDSQNGFVVTSETTRTTKTATTITEEKVSTKPRISPEARSTTEIADTAIATNLQPHAAGVKGPTDASNSPSFINPAKVIKPDNAQQERCSRFSEEQHRTLELRSERILEKLKLKTLTELITLQMNNQEEYVSNLIGDVIFEKRMNALNTLESQL
ncbi:unnamed protein product, partial [Aureobasidium pullulans]